jgi:bidirectional [NiFe] hydrogenase diaphorase subunit
MPPPNPRSPTAAAVSPAAVKVRTLTIDGHDIGAGEDETILDVAWENGIRIPALCHLEGLTPVGACRLCLVEVEGTNRLLPACVTRIEEGMRVTAHSERLERYRRMILELLFSEGNHICSVCVANGHCELQRLAQEQGMDHVRVPYLYARTGVDTSHPLFGLDQSRCILCTRCVRACGEVEGAHTWDVLGRGATSRVITDFGQPWGLSETCTNCSKCVNVCPTGALFYRGRGVGEMTRRPEVLAALMNMRERER